jgi:hypothetical protein
MAILYLSYKHYIILGNFYYFPSCVVYFPSCRLLLFAPRLVFGLLVMVSGFLITLGSDRIIAN